MNYIMGDRRNMMSNGIATRQNEDNSIAMLAAQRQLYRDAKKFNIISVALSVWVPFVLAVILLFIPSNTVWEYASYLLSIVSMFFSFGIDKYIEAKKQLAAFIQQKFDVYVYEMPWDKRIFGKDKNIDHEVVTYSKKILNDSQEKAKLKDWYTPAVDGKNIINGILACQRENFWWDVGLRKRFRLASLILIIILCVAILIMGLWKNEKVTELLWRVVFILPMLRWLLDTVTKLNRDISTLQELDGDINNDEIKTMEDLQDIQKVIFQHRKGCYTVPEFIYNVFKDNDEDRAYREATMSNR